MRATFIRTLTELAEHDPRILLLSGDLGYMVIDEFAKKHPQRFFNIGVAEQNMVGIATGLAEAGFIPFVYSIATFATLRPYEFIRNGPIFHRLPVRIVGVGGGFEYGYNGPTHYGIEDVGVMRLQPSMTVIAPADFQQTRSALITTWNLPSPVYYRLGKDEKTVVPGLEGEFEIGKAQMVRKGEEILFISMGSVTIEVVSAIDELAQKGISCGLAIVSCFNPSPIDDVAEIISHYALTISVEEHYITGGLGSLVAEVIAEKSLECRLIRCGLRDNPDGITGTHKFMLSHYGLSQDALVSMVLKQKMVENV